MYSDFHCLQGFADGLRTVIFQDRSPKIWKLWANWDELEIRSLTSAGKGRAAEPWRLQRRLREGKLGLQVLLWSAWEPGGLMESTSAQITHWRKSPPKRTSVGVLGELEWKKGRLKDGLLRNEATAGTQPIIKESTSALKICPTKELTNVSAKSAWKWPQRLLSGRRF